MLSVFTLNYSIFLRFGLIFSLLNNHIISLEAFVKRSLILTLSFSFILMSLLIAGCPGTTPTAPPTNSVAFTNTPTPNLTLGTATNTPTYTATLNLTLGTATYTHTPPPPTNTPTRTETPLCVSPFTFGKNFAGGSNSLFSANNLFASRYNLPVAGRITRLHAHFPNSIGANVRMALYSNAASQPGSLISESSPQVSVGGWNTFEIPDTAQQAAGIYWIALVCDSTGVGISYDTGASGDGFTSSLTFGPFSSSPAGTTTTYAYAFYADYCVTGGSPTPISTPTPTPTFTLTFTPTITPTHTPVPACNGNYSAGRNWPLSTTGVFNNYGSIFGNAITMTVAGRVTMLHYYSGGAGNNVSMALYTDNGGVPQNLITKSSPQGAVSGINNVDVPDTALLSPGVYWVIIRPDSGSNLNLYNAYPGAGNGGYWINDGAGDFPNVSTGGSDPGYIFSSYADYCIQGASPTPVHTLTWTFTPSFTPTFTHTYTQTPVPACNGSYVVGTNWPLSGHGVFNNYGYMFCNRVNLTVAGRVTSLHFLCGAAGSTVQMALYSNSGSAPNTLITSSSSQAAVSGVNNVDVPDTAVLPIGTYWVVAMPAYNNGVDFYNEYVGAPSNGYWMSNSGTFPASTLGGMDQGYNFSMWASHCVMAGSPTPVPWTPTPTNTFTHTMTPTETPLCGSPTTFGNTTLGSPGGFGSSNLLLGKYTLGAGKQVIKLNFYVHSLPTPAANIRMGIYTNFPSPTPVPGNLIKESSIQVAGLGWNVVDIPDTATLAAGTYWIGLVHNSGSGLNFSGLTSGFPGEGCIYSWGFSPLPATIGAGGTIVDWRFSYYGTTCP